VGKAKTVEDVREIINVVNPETVKCPKRSLMFKIRKE